MRESLRSIVGDDVEKRVDIGLAKDGSGVGGMPSSLFCSHVCFCFGVLDKSLVSLHLSLLLASCRRFTHPLLLSFLHSCSLRVTSSEANVTLDANCSLVMGEVLYQMWGFFLFVFRAVFY